MCFSQVLGNRLSASASSKGKRAGGGHVRKQHKLTQYSECKKASLGVDDCYRMVVIHELRDQLHYIDVNILLFQILDLLDTFFNDRAFMWPTFAGDGFNFNAA